MQEAKLNARSGLESLHGSEMSLNVKIEQQLRIYLRISQRFDLT